MAATSSMKYATEQPGAGAMKLPRSLFITVLLLTLGVFLGAIALMTFHLRTGMRKQIIQQDAEILHGAALVQEAEFLDDTASAEDALPALLSASTVRAVFAVRVFDAEGKFLTSFPNQVKPGTLSTDDLAALKNGSAISHYLKAGDVSDIYENQSVLGTVPLLQVLIPIRTSSQILGAAEFFLEGQNTALAFKKLDHDLITYAVGLWAAGSLIICPLMLWAYTRLQRANNLLAQRSADLLRANHELAMSAKTSAIGAVTAHLLHGIKNPLFGLHNFVSAHGRLGGANETTLWEAAADSTRRIQAMINDIVRILNESENSTTRYELTLQELGGILASRFTDEASLQYKNFKVEVNHQGTLQNHHGNLVTLILGNLVENGLQAVPVGGSVEVRSGEVDGAIVFRVSDTGPGLPPEKARDPFVPGRSSKAAGSGIGLAISKQLAQHLGATLELESTSSSGTIFKLTCPGELIIRQKEVAEQAVLVR